MRLEDQSLSARTMDRLAALKQTRERVSAESRALVGKDDDWTSADQRRARDIETDLDELDRKIHHTEKQLDFARRSDAQSETPTPGGPRGEVFEHLGEQIRAIVQAGMPGGEIDRRLYQVAKLAPSGMGESVASDGGFAVEPTFVAQIERRMYESAPVASRCRKFPIGANSNGIKLPIVDETSRATGSRLGGVRVYRTAEAETVATSKPKLGRLEIGLEKLMGLAYATEELLQDSAQTGAFIEQAFAEELAFAVDDEILRGTGAGQCLGILNSPALVTVAKESGPQAADTVVLANIHKMWSRMWARSRRNAIWLVNQDVEPQLLGLAVTVGSVIYPAYLPPGGASAAPYGTLMGRPVIPIEQCATLGDLGDVVLADLSQYVLIDRPARFAASMHVRFIYDEMAFRITYRINGQPVWKSALTPYKGANTLSPFVTLEAR